MTAEKLKKELQVKYYNVKVRDRYEVIKANDLLKQIDVIVFPTDQKLIDYINSKSTFKDSYMMKDSEGWRIQSHFISDDNTIETLEKDVKRYQRKVDKIVLNDKDVEECEDLLFTTEKKLEFLFCYLFNNYSHIDDIKDLPSSFDYIFERISEKFDVDFSSYKRQAEFTENFTEFLSNKKMWERDKSIDSLL